VIEAKDPAPSPQDLKKGIPQGPILRPDTKGDVSYDLAQELL